MEQYQSQSNLTVLLCHGDSLTEGYGLKKADAYPALLETSLKSRGWAVTCLNHGVSGDTTKDGLRRLARALEHAHSVGQNAVETGRYASYQVALLLELGINDLFQGVPVTDIENNLRRILSEAQSRTEGIMLLAVRVPPLDHWPDYEDYNAMFAHLAQAGNFSLQAYFPDNLRQDAHNYLADGLHPSAKGYIQITEALLPAVERFLRSLEP